MTRIYHIATADAASRAEQTGQYFPEAFGSEGFIHCSYKHQLAGVIQRFFRGKSGLVLFEIDQTRIDAKIIDENLEGGSELFPHVYGVLPMSAVVGVHDLDRGLSSVTDPS